MLRRLWVEHLFEAVDFLVTFVGRASPEATIPDHDLRLMTIDDGIIHDFNADWVPDLVRNLGSHSCHDYNWNTLLLVFCRCCTTFILFFVEHLKEVRLVVIVIITGLRSAFSSGWNG